MLIVLPLILGEFHEWTGVSQGQFQKMLEEYGYTFNWLRTTKAACYTAALV